MFVHATSGKSKNKNNLLELVGKQAVAHTDHHPEGLVKVKGETMIPFALRGTFPKERK